MGKFEIKKDKAGKLRFNLKASNGQVILTSEAYNSKAACVNGIKSVKKNSQNEKLFDKKKAKNGRPYFSLKASNGQVIAASQMYASASSMANGIESVKRNAPIASVVLEYETDHKRLIEFTEAARELEKPIVDKGQIFSTWLNKLSFLKNALSHLNENSSFNYNDIVPLINYLELRQEDIASFFDVDPSTISRWKTENGKIGKLQSKNILIVDSIMSKGIRIFGNENRFKSWLHTPNDSLGGAKPINLIRDPFTLETVNKALEALSWGTYI